MTKTNSLRTTLAALLCAAAAAPALAQTADLQTWTTAGDVLVTSATSASLSTAYTDESPLSAGGALQYFELEPALALVGGSLAPDTYEGSGLQHSFVAAAGATISFQWQLTTVDFSADQADRAFVLVDGSTLVALGTVAANPVSGLFSHTFADAGPHALAVLVMDVGDYVGVSTLGISGLSVSAVPEPGQWAMLLAGLAGVGALARRRAAQATR
jgi:PEP-CTERM motif